jgi:hypothetical protein
MVNRTNPTRAAAWRAAFDLTEAQASAVVALIAARVLGYDGATVEELVSIGASCLGSGARMSDLVRLRMVECVGLTEETRPRKVWGPTAAAFRRFGVEAPPSAYAALSPIDCAEASVARYDERQRRYHQRKREQRMKESA